MSKNFFTKMGSKHIWDVKYRHSFGFIGICGRKQATEKRGLLPKLKVIVIKTFLIISDQLPHEFA